MGITPSPPIVGGDIYFIDYMTDGTFFAPRRMTSNTYTDIFPTLAPDGRGKLVFDSNRFRAAGEPVNTSNLFLMNHDGTELQFLTRGGSPTWSPRGPNGAASKNIAFHASGSGTGLPVNRFPGSATVDSDIFTVNVDDLLKTAPCHGTSPSTGSRRWTMTRTGHPMAGKSFSQAMSMTLPPRSRPPKSTS